MVVLRAASPPFLDREPAPRRGRFFPLRELHPGATMSLLKKILVTLRPFYDFRALLLLCICLGIGVLTDPAATLGLARVSGLCHRHDRRGAHALQGADALSAHQRVHPLGP